MIWLSEILLAEQQLASFSDLKQCLKQKAIGGEIFFGIDIKPQFSDTPENWEDLLESIFVARH